MSDVIRTGIIRLKIELEKSGAGSFSGAGTAIQQVYDAQRKAAAESAKAISETASRARDYVKAARDGASATDSWATGVRKLNSEWKKSGGGRDAWAEGLQRMRQQKEEEFATLDKTNAAWKEARNQQTAFGLASVRSMGESTEGVMALMRGIALMSASGQKDLAAMLGSIVKIEAAMSFVRGASGLAKLAAAFGPVGVAVGAVTATVGAGVMMWSRYTERQREAIEMAKKHREEARKLEQQLADNWREQHNREAADRSRRQAGFELRREAALTPEQESQITSAAQRRIDEERKSISKNWRQRTGGFRDTDEGFSQLTQFGRTANWENARNLEQRKADLAQRQYNLDKERFERERERQDFAAGAQATAFGTAAAGGLAFGLPGIGATAGLNTVNTENARIMQKLLESQNQMLNKAVDAYDKAAERITELERRLAGSQN